MRKLRIAFISQGLVCERELQVCFLADLHRWTEVCGDPLPPAGSRQHCDGGSARSSLERHVPGGGS